MNTRLVDAEVGSCWWILAYKMPWNVFILTLYSPRQNQAFPGLSRSPQNGVLVSSVQLVADDIHNFLPGGPEEGWLLVAQEGNASRTEPQEIWRKPRKEAVASHTTP